MPSKIRCRLLVISLLFSGLFAYAQLRPGEKAAQTAGAVRVNPKDGLKYVWISPGTFQMGCSPGDNECNKAEKPSHQVSITKGFWLGQTDVTAGAYKRFAEASSREMPDAPDFNNGWANVNMPIVDVSWDDANDYCGWAGGRLPTEAEWEYAARGGSTEARYGNLDEIAWYASNSGGATHNVAQKHPNRFGLYDMLGNVWQWVNDPYDPDYYQNSPSQDPPGPSSGRLRVLRGASWDFSPQFIRLSNRMGDTHSDWDYNFGFRCAGDVLNP
jgi:formylglycine-generating enzyme required for sulfatase activity